MTRIFDNIDQDLLTTLRGTLQVSRHADFCVGYLNLRGWQAVDDLVQPWNPLDGQVCRVLVGMQRPPHVAEELWAILGHAPSVSQQPWPVLDPALIVSDRLTIPVQVNGKLRGKIEVAADTARDVVERAAREIVAEWLQGGEPKKVIYVEKKLVNFVI